MGWRWRCGERLAAAAWGESVTREAGGGPPLITGFESSASRTGHLTSSWKDMFVVLHGGSRILHANGTGQTALYDADSRSVVCVPDLGEPKGFMPMPFVVPGTGEEEEDESLYVLRSVLVEPPYHTAATRNFEVLDFGGSGSGGDNFCDRRSNLLKWQPLPSPPSSPDNLGSSTVIDSGRTICVSSYMSEGGSTYCFNTAKRQWWHAGDWALPFAGRAEYVPELETWVGFSPDHSHHLCSTDLTGVVVCRTSLEWTARQLHLVRLGSGKLCVVKVFDAEETVSLSCSFDDYQEPMDKLTVLVGVEVVRGGAGGGLRMIKHKTKHFIFPGNSINCAL